MIQVQQPAPPFNVEAVTADGQIERVRLNDYQGRYVTLLFYPLDFTFVCPTEILGFAARINDFESRNCAVLGVSVDSVHTHLAWRRVSPEDGGIGAIPFPLLADLDKRMSREYGVLIETAGHSARGLFLLDRQGIVRSMIINDLPLGRNVDEVLRLIDALQYSEQYGEVCPANWHPGRPALQPTLESVKAYARQQLVYN